MRLHRAPAPSGVDLTAAAEAIAAGAVLSIGPTGGLATRAPELMRGDAARAFIDRARHTLRPVTRSPEARAALLSMLRPWPEGWGSAGGCSIVAVLWAPGAGGLDAVDVGPGHRATDGRAFVRSLRREALAGPRFTDRHARPPLWEGHRTAARVHTGAFMADLAAVDRAVSSAATLTLETPTDA